MQVQDIVRAATRVRTGIERHLYAYMPAHTHQMHEHIQARTHARVHTQATNTHCAQHNSNFTSFFAVCDTASLFSGAQTQTRCAGPGTRRADTWAPYIWRAQTAQKGLFGAGPHGNCERSPSRQTGCSHVQPQPYIPRALSHSNPLPDTSNTQRPVHITAGPSADPWLL